MIIYQMKVGGPLEGAGGDKRPQVWISRASAKLPRDREKRVPYALAETDPRFSNGSFPDVPPREDQRRRGRDAKSDATAAVRWAN